MADLRSGQELDSQTLSASGQCQLLLLEGTRFRMGTRAGPRRAFQGVRAEGQESLVELRASLTPSLTERVSVRGQAED